MGHIHRTHIEGNGALAKPDRHGRVRLFGCQANIRPTVFVLQARLARAQDGSNEITREKRKRSLYSFSQELSVLDFLMFWTETVRSTKPKIMNTKPRPIPLIK